MGGICEKVVTDCWLKFGDGSRVDSVGSAGSKEDDSGGGGVVGVAS
jgi:hypothetical protein